MTPKFRAWIKDFQVMRSVEFLAFSMDGSIAEVFTLPVDGEPDEFRHTHRPEQVVLMQSTGLKDANGNEIYEGDLVLWQWGEIGDGVFTNSGKKIADSNPHTLVMLEEADSLVVLGNIHENPELASEFIEEED